MRTLLPLTIHAKMPRFFRAAAVLILALSYPHSELCAFQVQPIASRLWDRHRWSSLNAYSAWLKSSVSYRRDEGSPDWASTETTLNRGYGDCKDYAVANRDFLKAMGYESKIFTVTSSDRSMHAICVFKVKGRYVFMNNASLEPTAAQTWEEFSDYILLHFGYFCPMVVP